MSPIEAALLLLGAGVVAGVVGSGGGVSSLVSYPALLGVGIPPLQANIANLVAGVAIAPGAAVSSRRELTDARPALIGLLPVAVAGTVLGAGLLLLTPPRVFAHVVPFLVVAGSVVLILQPALLKLRGRADVEGGLAAPTVLLIGAVSVYGGYFGAGSGVMLLAVLLLLVDSRIPPANAIKNVLLGAISLAATAVFIAFRPVPWSAVLLLASGLLVGSSIGPIIVRHLPPSLVRWIAASFGLMLAANIGVTPPSLRLAPGPSSTVPSLRLAVGAFPALERVLDFTNRGPLILISGFQTPTAIRRLGHVRLARWLERRGVRGADRLAHAAAAAASRQTVEISGASAATSLIARLAQAVLELDRQLADLDRQVSGMFRAHPDAAIITSLTGICDVLGAEFLAAPGGSLAGFASADYLAGYAGPRPHPIRLRLPDRQSAPASAI